MISIVPRPQTQRVCAILRGYRLLEELVMGIRLTSGMSLILPMVILASSWAQNPREQGVPPCGDAKVRFPNPEYLTTKEGIIVVQLPWSWVRDKTQNWPFYFVRRGESYSNARTLMYIVVEPLEVPFERAVQNDIQSFQKRCEKLVVRDLKPADLLEQGCERKTQTFSCQKKKGSHVDLVTKIAFRGSLLNVVLTADTSTEVSRYRNDYEFILKHITMIK